MRTRKPDAWPTQLKLPGQAAAPDGPVVVLLSTYDEDQFDLDGCGAAAYVTKAAFGPDRLSAAWADAAR